MDSDHHRATDSANFLHRVRQIGYALRYRTPPDLPLRPDRQMPVFARSSRRSARTTSAICSRSIGLLKRPDFRKQSIRVRSSTTSAKRGCLARECRLPVEPGTSSSADSRRPGSVDWRHMRLPIISNELFIAHHHATIGADRLEALGVPQSVCDVVRHHDATNLTDPAIQALQKIDSATP